MENLKFRRQYLFSATKCAALEHWPQEIVGSHTLYVHPDCKATHIEKTELNVILVGHILDPKHPFKTIFDILSNIAELSSTEQVSDYLYGLSGRFVLIIKKRNKLFFFNDACGLKTLYYTLHRDEVYAASQPLLFNLVFPITAGKKHQEYFTSSYPEKNLEHWIPAGATLYENVYHLTPNHFFESHTYKQVRYFPKKPLKRRNSKNAGREFSSLLKNIMFAANLRFPLALPLTAGLDSRIILSACKDIITDVHFYTLQYRNLTKKSNDIRIPQKLLRKLGLKHHIIDCRIPIKNNFENVYLTNTEKPHLNDWGKIAYGIYIGYPQHRIALKGNCAEIARCFYYPNGEHKDNITTEDLINLENGWRGINFIEERIAEWHLALKECSPMEGYNLLDLFYWENKMGGWQAQGQLEWDIAQDTFSPFNNRQLIDIMLSVNPKHRCSPDYSFFKKCISVLWKKVLKEPINPEKQKYISNRLKTMFIPLLQKLGIYNKIKSILKKND